MKIRHLLLIAAVAVGSAIGLAPEAKADTACAWVDPYGVCISNPTGNVPKAPKAPKLPAPHVPDLP
jgi:hypothetical protein